MNKTKIDWCDYTINPVKGKCPMGCSYCYARRMYDRFKWNPRMRYDPASWLGVGSLRKPSKIFVGSTYELFHRKVPNKYLKLIFEVPLEFPQHTFIFLTKQPYNLIRCSPLPSNCWIGITVNSNGTAPPAYYGLNQIKAKVRFISFEPLMGQIGKDELRNLFQLIDWCIIGQQTPSSKKTEPKVEWIKEIVDVADKTAIPVFLKDNILELVNYHNPETDFAFNKDGYYRQEFPR